MQQLPSAAASEYERTDLGLVTKIATNMKRQATKKKLNLEQFDKENDDTDIKIEYKSGDELEKR